MIYNGKGNIQYNLASTPLKAGGEGEIYDIIGQSNLVAKIYKPGKTGPEKERKLIRMVNFPPDKSVLSQIAWPLDVLYNAGKFAGFVMPKMKINEDLNVIYEYGSSAKYPDMQWENRIIIAKNLCVVLHYIHISGYVCGDLNPKNISVDPGTGFVVFLDTDSYHIEDGKNVYRCDVGMPEYLPVEIQKKMRGGRNLATAALPTFSADTDNFALAIHIFQLLMNGVHPFACAVIPSQSSVTAPQPSDNIERGEFPFMQNVSGIRIPVFAPKIGILPKDIQDLFKRAFIDGHNSPGVRPKPDEWHTALNSLAQELKTCKKVSHHQYYKSLSSCPWCEANESFNKAINKSALAQTQIKPPVVQPGLSTTSPVNQYGTSTSYGRTQIQKSWWQRLPIGARVAMLTILVGALFLGFSLLNKTESAVSVKPKSVPKMEMIISNGNEIQSVDPTRITSTNEHRVYEALFEGLVTYDPQTALIAPGVAESWTYNSDNTVITFTLRDGIVWSDGTPITAQTVVDSWLYRMNPSTASEYAYVIGLVVKGGTLYSEKGGKPSDVAIRAVDVTHFEVTLSGPAAYAVDMMAHYAFAVLPMHVINKYGNKWTNVENFVGNGPFVLSERIPNSRTVVVPNEKYWNRANVFLTRITFLPINNANTAYNMFLNGELDWATDIPLDRIDEVKLHKDYQVSSQLGTYYVLVNNKDYKPLADPRVRKALSMAFNRQELIDKVLRGGQVPATALVPPMPGYTPTTGNGYNVTEARRLLAEAGYPNGRGLPTFEYVNTNNIIGEYLQQAWKNNLGVNINLQIMEWASYLDYRDTPSMQLARAGWIADYMDPQNFLELLISNTGNNHSKYINSEYDRLIRQAASMPAGAQRNAVMRQAEDIAITRDQAVIPVYYYVSQNMIDLTKWDGWYTNPMDVQPFTGIRRK